MPFTRLPGLLSQPITWKHGLVMLLISIALTEAVVATMGHILLGRVPADYLWTGLVASFLVASLVGGVILRVADHARHLAMSLAASEGRLRSLYELSPLGIALTDPEGRHVDCNGAYLALSGYSREQLSQRDFFSLTADEDVVEEARQARLFRDTGRLGPYEKEILRQDGSRVPVRVHGIALPGTDGQQIWSIVEDISEQRRKDELIWTQANHDVLTNLPNRRLLLDRLPLSLAASQRSGQYGALLMLDLDQFKTLNDTRGHAIGDRLLIEVAGRLQACMRDQDSVARLGGDEFAIVMEGLSRDMGEAAIQSEAVAEKIRAAMTPAFLLDGQEQHLSVSIGIVLFQGQQNAPTALFSFADAAMFEAKRHGRDRICFHDAAMQAVLEKRSALEKGLRQALQREEFRLYYQLQVGSSGSRLGVEALIRWQHPEMGAIPPAEFIPIAEETGLILPIGRWVVEEACRQIASWQRVPDLADLCVAVNVSARQFQDPGFVRHIQAQIAANGIPPERLKLELTESMILDQVETNIARMRELKAIGVGFSLDDFGTCYSSLAYLKRLPLDQLKIDRSFVLDITRDGNDAAIVKAILAMASSMGLETIAEGVESGEQRTFLEEHGCHAYQGYLFGRPLPAEELERVLAGEAPLAHPE